MADREGTVQMRQYMPTTYESGHHKADPGWAGLLAVPTVFLTAFVAWFAVATAPHLVLGVVAGTGLHYVARRAAPLARELRAVVHRTVDRTPTETRMGHAEVND